jgi:hypothetical protein
MDYTLQIQIDATPITQAIPGLEFIWLLLLSLDKRYLLCACIESIQWHFFELTSRASVDHTETLTLV